MLRRTTTILALAVGALAAGFVVTGQTGVDNINLTGSQSSISTVKLGQIAPIKTSQLSPAKPSQVSPVKPGQLTTVKPIQVTPAKPGQVSPAKPVTPVKVGQVNTLQLKEITSSQALQARVGKIVRLGKIVPVVITSRTPDGRCSLSGGRGLFDTPYDVDVTGIAWYRTIPGTPGFYEWFQFQYKLDGLISGGNHSNATIRMYEAGTPKFQNSSPDDRRLGQWYYVTPTSPVYTRTTSSVNFEFEGTFDRSRRSDPRCIARTGRL